MPLLKLQTTVSVPKDRQGRLMAACSAAVGRLTGKPEEYIMIILEEGKAAMLAGKETAAAFVDIRGIGGLNPAVNKKLSAALCEVLAAELNIRPELVYLNFTDVPASNWGWNGSTFG